MAKENPCREKSKNLGEFLLCINCHVSTNSEQVTIVKCVQYNFF